MFKLIYSSSLLHHLRIRSDLPVVCELSPTFNHLSVPIMRLTFDLKHLISLDINSAKEASVNPQNEFLSSISTISSIKRGDWIHIIIFAAQSLRNVIRDLIYMAVYICFLYAVLALPRAYMNIFRNLVQRLNAALHRTMRTHKNNFRDLQQERASRGIFL